MKKVYPASLIAKRAIDACRPIMGMQNYDSLSRQGMEFVYFVAIGMSNIITQQVNTYVKEEGIEYVSVGAHGIGDNANVHVAIGGCNNVFQWWPIHGDKYSELVDKEGQVMPTKTTVVDGMCGLLGIQVLASECKKTTKDGIRVLGVRSLIQLRHGNTLIMVMSRQDEITVTIGDIVSEARLKGQKSKNKPWEVKNLPKLMGKTRATSCKYCHAHPTSGTDAVVKTTAKSQKLLDAHDLEIEAIEAEFAEDLEQHETTIQENKRLDLQDMAAWEKQCAELKAAAKQGRGGRRKRTTPPDVDLPDPPAKRPRPETPEKREPPVAPKPVFELKIAHTVRLSLPCSEFKPRLPCSSHV